MKAIVNVHPNSAFAQYNGLTFEVAELMSSQIGLWINGNITDFTYRGVIIVNLQQELQRAYEMCQWGGGDSSKAMWNTLSQYQQIHKINFTPVHVSYN